MAALLVVGGPALAQTDTLMHPPQTTGAATILTYSPDGTRVLFTAHLDDPGVAELYLYSLFDDSVTKVNGPLASGGAIGTTVSSPNADYSAAFSWDGARVIYMAGEDTSGVSELYAYDIATQTRVKLNGALPPGHAVQLFTPSTVDDRVVFNTTEIPFSDERPVTQQSVWNDGSGLVVINHPYVPGDTIRVQKHVTGFSSDGASIIGRTMGIPAGGSFGLRMKLYHAPLAGGNATEITPALPNGSEETVLEIVGVDGDQWVFRMLFSDSGTGGHNVPALFSVSASTWNPVLLAAPPSTIGEDGVRRFWAAPDGQRVVYCYVGDGSVDFFVIPTGGGAAQAITMPSSPGFLDTDSGSAFTTDSQTLVTWRRQGSYMTVIDLNAASAAVTAFSPGLGGSGNSRLDVTDDDASVVFGLQDGSSSQIGKLYRFDLGSGQITQLDTQFPVLAVGGGFDSQFIKIALINTPSPAVLYAGVTDPVEETVELIEVPLAGGAPTIRNSVQRDGGLILRVHRSPLGNALAYPSNHGDFGVHDAFLLRYASGSAPEAPGGIEIDGPATTNADSVSFTVVFNTPVNLTEDDVTVVGLPGAVSISGGPVSFIITVTLDDPDADGTVGIEIGTTVTDLDGTPIAEPIVSPVVTINNSLSDAGSPFPPVPSGTPAAGPIGLALLAGAAMILAANRSKRGS